VTTSAIDPNDPVIKQLREQLSDNDAKIVEAINARLKLVAELKRVKDERGFNFLDPAREEWLLQYLAQQNRGPLSAEGLREFYTELLDLTKRELSRDGSGPE
jgi:chorismate mutase